MVKYFSLLLAVFLAFSASPAAGKVSLDVYGQAYKKVTIGVPDFKTETPGRPRNDMNELLGQDLDMSGFFVVAPRSLMDASMIAEGMDRKDIRFEGWRSLGVELLCKGKVQDNDGSLTLEAYVYDTSDGTLFFAKRYRTKPEEWKRLVHRLADDIILAVTGEKGIMGSRIVFVGGDGRRKEVYTSDLDGSGSRKLTDYGRISLSPSVSPDGKYLAFTSYREGRPNLYVIETETGRQVWANREEGMKISGSWLDRKTLAFSHTSGRISTIYAEDVESKSRKTLFQKEGILTSPNFTPDGRKMVFVSDMFGGPQIFVKDMVSNEVKRISYAGTYNTAPSVSPKGDLIAFGCNAGGGLEICVMNTDGSNQRILTDGGINDSPQFSPDGRYILYSSKKGKKTGIYLMLFNGENKRLLKLTDEDESQPRFLP